MNKYRILSLDGGGIRGLIQARILQKIEDETESSIHELFDLIAGTSTGGILAACLAHPGHPWKAEELVNFYIDDGKKIFGRYRTRWHGCPFIRKIMDICGPRYDATPLENIMSEKLNDTRLKHTKPHLVVTSYDIECRRPYFFKTTKARNVPQEDDHDHWLKDVVRATTAAPTYFRPHKLGGPNRPPGTSDRRRVLVDGGVFANNPSMIAISEAVSEQKIALDQIIVCSIGSGCNDRPYRYRRAKHWGLWGWSRRLSYVMLDGMSDSAHYHSAKLLEKGNYFRFGDVKLKHANDDIDDVSDDNMNELNKVADQIIENERDEFKILCDLLLKEKGKQNI